MTGAFAAADRAIPADLTRILVIRLGGIGDIVLTTPTLRLLRSRFRNAKIDVLVQQGFKDVLLGLEYVNHVFELDKRFDLGLVKRLIQAGNSLHLERYDLVVNLQPGLKTFGLTRMAAAKAGIAFKKDRSIQRDTGKVRHAIDDFINSLAPLGIFATQDHSLDFYVPVEAEDVIDATLSGYDVTKHDQLIVLNPTATRRVNRWNAESWARVIDHYTPDRDCRICVVGGSRETSTVGSVRRLCRSWSDVIDLSCRLSLKQLGALLTRASVLVSGDTGPMHIGAALGTPIICISGAADPNRSGPLTSNSTILIDRSLPCVSCGSKRCRYGNTPRCMSLIEPEQVIAAISTQLARRDSYGFAVSA